MKDINGYFINRKITRQKVEVFLNNYRTNKLTLDLGAKNSPYRSLFPNSVTIDIDPLSKPDFLGDAHNLSMFKKNHFEVILCTEVLEHLHDPARAISEMKRVLKKGGLIILTTRFIFPIHDSPGDYYRFTKYGLMNLFNDFQVIELTEETTTIETIAVILQRVGFQSEVLGTDFLKLFFFLLAEFVKHLSFLLSNQYGGLRKEKHESQIMSSGYLMVVKKR